MARTGIPVAPPKPKTPNAPASTSHGGQGGGGGGKKPVDPYAAAMAAQKRAESKARNEANKRALRDAATMGLQARALRKALSSQGFQRALRIGLANTRRVQGQTDRMLVEGYNTRVGSLQRSADDNEKAAAGQSGAALINRVREQANALSEATANGAGESDVLRAQQMSLRNWNANQSEVNRSFYDSLTSVNASLNDLTVDTKTGRINNALAAEEDRGQLYGNYFDQMSQTYTQLGNVLGQQASDYSAALEQVSSKKTRRKQRRAQQQSGAAFMNASRVAGRAYSSPGASAALRSWGGAAPIEGQLNNSANINAGSTVTDLARPEGASLRKWTP